MSLPVVVCVCGCCEDSGYSIIINIKSHELTAETALFKCQFAEFETWALPPGNLRFYSPVPMDSAIMY